jgi:glycosidase
MTIEALKTQTIYEIYVRAHGPNGTFSDVTTDLERIKHLGVDIIWFMPIHPIGIKDKKGSLGCPYAISDYRAINPEYGSLSDFKSLIEKAHQLNLKVMIDVVYNHTAPDARILTEHPEWYHLNAAGIPASLFADWTDVIDLKFGSPSLTQYLIECLCYWSTIGVDGFRCDVASAVPVEFWVQARQAVAKINPNTIWLAESTHARFLEKRRERGLYGACDAELYQAFDITYDHDIWPIFTRAMKAELSLSRYAETLRYQTATLPTKALKLRCVENHDQPRIMHLIENTDRALAWTAFESFNQGPFLVYAGQESGATHCPSLFEREAIDWAQYEWSSYLKQLISLKKHAAVKHGNFSIQSANEVLEASWYYPEKSLCGIFNTSGTQGTIKTLYPEGEYQDLISGDSFKIHKGEILAPKRAFIFEVVLDNAQQHVHSEMMDY